MQQAARVSQRTAFFHLGYLVEEDFTDQNLHESNGKTDGGPSLDGSAA